MIRNMDIDTPEIFHPEICETKERTRAVLDQGYAAQGRFDRLLRQRNVRVDTYGKDRYGRTIGRVWVGDEKASDILIREGYGRPYACPKFRCPKRESWC